MMKNKCSVLMSIQLYPNKQFIQNFLELLELLRTFWNFLELYFSIIIMGTCLELLRTCLELFENFSSNNILY